MSDFLDEARSGNKTAVRIVPLQGALEITTSQGVHRINRTEVDQYGGGGNLYDRLAGKVGGVLTGKNITDDVLNSMDALQQKISQNSQTLYQNKLDLANKTYNSHFTPTFGTPRTASGPPPGATHIVPGPDGKNHYTNAAGTWDGGVAP
jgi:ethanolamine utilization microcompartment shell protein EutL